MPKKRNLTIYLYLCISVVLCLMLATRSSFLYPLNNWDDANSYFSMGKAIFNGKMPYRDVFDQKGMYLYFLYGIAYLISHTTFKGVFILEIILGILDVIGFYKIILLFTDEFSYGKKGKNDTAGNVNINANSLSQSDSVKRTVSAVLAVFTFAAVVCSRSFWWGGAAEEICLPCYVWGLYLSVRYFRKTYPEKTMPFKDVFFGGILAGLIANIKFTGLGFFFAWMMMVFFSFLAHKEFLDGIKACFVFLFGMFLSFVPWIIYFGVQNSLFEWYWGYVYVNVFVYTDVENANPGLFGRMYQLAKLLYWLVRDNWQYFVFVIVGMIFAVFGKKQKLLARLNVPVLFVFMFLGFFGNGRELPYYSLPLSVFAVLGFAFAGKIAENVIDKGKKSGKASIRKNNDDAIDGIKQIFNNDDILSDNKKSENPRENLVQFGIIIPLTCTLISMLFIYANSMNIPFMKVERDEYFMYRFRDEVLQTDNPTLLNVGCLDAGLYTLCDIVPTCRWFQTQTLNIKEPENNPYLEQERYVREGLVDYVLVRDHIPDSIDVHYDLIDNETYGWDGNEFKYYLYKKVR